MKTSFIERLKQQFNFIDSRQSIDYEAVNVPVQHIVEFCTHLRDELGFDMLVDLTAIDWGVEASPRFTAIYHFFSSMHCAYFRVACECLDNEHPTMTSISNIWPAANWHEREAYDMFGIKFQGHPDLKRILMWPGYPYYPLRKDFPLAGIETDLPGKDVVEETKAKVIPAPLAGGPFHGAQASTMKKREPKGYDESWTEKHPRPL